MLQPAIALDAEMTAAEVLERLALNGFWRDPHHPAAQARIERLRADTKKPFDVVAAALVRDVREHGAAIRRQWGTHVLWYARPLEDVLGRCADAPADALLVDVLDLHEHDSGKTIDLQADESTLLSEGVVMEHGRPVGVSLPDRAPTSEDWKWLERGTFGGSTRSSDPLGIPPLPEAAGPAAAADAQVWPRIEAPDFVPAAQAFDVEVGFALQQQAGLSGGAMTLPFVPGTDTLDLTIELSAGRGVDAPDGWSRPLRVSAHAPGAASASFRLIGLEPNNRERAWLTMIEVRYVLAGTVCGTAARPLVVLPSDSAATPSARPYGVGWHTTSTAASPIALVGDPHPPDLTVEITKPDRNAASGSYVCQLRTPHGLDVQRGRFPIDLGQDAKTFAKSIVEEIRMFSASELLESTIESIGRLIADRLPPQVFEALRDVAAKVAPDVPAVLIVSAEPYVPWELAWMDPPLDDQRPSCLGAQALVGRWLRDSTPEPSAESRASTVVMRPATHPISQLGVRNMAVMAAWYQASSGLRRLPKAEQEAKALADNYPSVPLLAMTASVRQLLNASLQRGFERVAVEAVHFAGHGDFDPTRPEAAALLLEDGTPLRATMFRAAKYGGDRQPLLFLNACMLGIGGELLGDMGGFPGHSLRGGFGGVLGALWEVDDTVAHDIALEFWRRALPPPPASGEPIASILRDLRARYVPGTIPAPVATYLAYVYYGHPRLTLQRLAA
jgi:hypothetical protein